ncbi:hypothetical protein Tco_1143151 [Tanacetum coccineum]
MMTLRTALDYGGRILGRNPIGLKGVCILKRLLINRERMANVMNGTKNGLYFSASVCIIVGHPDIYSTEWYSEEDDQAVLPEEGLTKSVLSTQLAAIIKANLIWFVIKEKEVAIYSFFALHYYIQFPASYHAADIASLLVLYQIFVKEVMELVKLTPLKGALVGLHGVNCLAAEQRKRATISVN